jgi:SNF2 family DNA or RNA helicase
MILALDMGLGKTIIGSVWAKAFKETFTWSSSDVSVDKGSNLKIFVVCPVSLKEEWKRTAEERVGLAVEREGTAAAKSSTKAKKQKIATEEDDGLNMQICSWAKVPTVVERHVKNFVVVCDEAHSMQSTQAQRTQDVLKLVRDKRYVPL